MNVEGRIGGDSGLSSRGFHVGSTINPYKSVVSFFGDIGKQSRPRSDASECSI